MLRLDWRTIKRPPVIGCPTIGGHFHLTGLYAMKK